MEFRFRVAQRKDIVLTVTVLTCRLQRTGLFFGLEHRGMELMFPCCILVTRSTAHRADVFLMRKHFRIESYVAGNAIQRAVRGCVQCALPSEDRNLSAIFFHGEFRIFVAGETVSARLRKGITVE